MPIISFKRQSFPPIAVPSGAPLMEALLKANVPVASSCHGDGVCGKCRVQVHSPQNLLSEKNDLEKFLLEKFQMKEHERVSCQCRVLGSVEIDTTYW